METLSFTNLEFAILVIGYTLMLIAIFQMVTWFKDLKHPIDELAWPKKHIRRKINYMNPLTKKPDVGKLVGIMDAKGESGKGKPNMSLIIEDGPQTMKVSIYSKWSLA